MMFPKTLGVCAIDVYIGAGHPTVSCFLHFKYLSLSVMICVCCKNKLVQWLGEIYCTDLYQGEYLEYS